MEPKGRKTQLIRGLSLTTAIMIVAGSMIGSGIFRKPSTMAGQLLSPELLIIIWIAAGLITLIGAMVNSEVAGMFDKTGGQYIYFREMYGSFISYLYGWSILSVIQSGSQAAIAYVFAEYLGYFVQYPEAPEFLRNFSFTMPLVGEIQPFIQFGTKVVAILCILFLTFVNYIGVIFGGLVQNIVTFIKIASIIILAVLLFTLGDGSTANLYNNFTMPENLGDSLFVVIGLALAGAFWAYDGWNNVTFISGEIKNPQKNVPLGLLYGTLIVIVVYAIINLAFLYVLPVEVMKDSPLVAASAAEIIFGPVGATIISITVIISTFGALNGSLLPAARVQFAMARNGHFFKSIGKVHPKFATPHNALLLQGIWSAVLVLSGTFDTITDYVIFATWCFYMLGAAGVFILRKKMPDTPRPYKVWGYPYTPIIFVVFSFIFLMNSLISDTQNAMIGLILIFSGLPIYYYLRWKEKKSETNDSETKNN